MADIVCVGAHPDDVEIGMGGTVAGFVRRGLSVVIVDLTDGEPTPHGTPEIRARESERAAEVLGAQRVTLDLPNRYLFDGVDARRALAEVLREHRPHTLYIPFPQDAHPDHLAASSIALAARFYAKLTKTDMQGEPHYPARVYHYMAVHLRLIREPSFVVDISRDLPTKLEALRAYESQFAHNPANADVISMIEMNARMWGASARVDAGEPFFAIETLCVSEPEQLI